MSIEGGDPYKRVKLDVENSIPVKYSFYELLPIELSHVAYWIREKHVWGVEKLDEEWRTQNGAIIDLEKAFSKRSRNQSK